MRRRTLGIVVGGAVAVVAGIAVAVSVSATERSPGDASTGVRSTQNPHDVATYWTDERMRDATGD